MCDLCNDEKEIVCPACEGKSPELGCVRCEGTGVIACPKCSTED